MTDDEIDKAMDRVEYRRVINNHNFCEWLRMSFKCPNCRDAAARYEASVIVEDEKIDAILKPLSHG